MFDIVYDNRLYWLSTYQLCSKLVEDVLHGTEDEVILDPTNHRPTLV